MAKKGYRIMNLKKIVEGLIEVVDSGVATDDELEKMIHQCLEASPLIERYQKKLYEINQKRLLDPNWANEMYMMYEEDLNESTEVCENKVDDDLDMNMLLKKIRRIPVFLSLVSTSRKRIKEVFGEEEGEALIKAVTK